MKFRFLMPLVGLTVLALQTPASAADMLTISGHARTRLSYTDNITGATATTANTAPGTANVATVGNNGDTPAAEQWDSRVRMNMDLAPSSSVKVRISPEFTHTWNNNGTGAPASGAFTAHEAWMSWMPNNMVTVTLGRQILSYGNEIILGANDWYLGNTFDAMKLRFHHNMGSTDFFYGKLVENSLPSAAGRPDNDLWGLYNQLKVGSMNQFFSNLDLYVLWNDARNHGAATRSRVATLGARANGASGMLDYNIELAYQQGKALAKDVKGFMVDGEVGGKFQRVHHLALGFGYANSEFVNQFPTRHGKLGDADVLTRNNLMHIALLTNWMWNDQWSSKINGWWFMRAATGTGITTGTAGYTTTAGNNDRNVAMEGDLAVTYKADKALSFDFGYAMFKPMSALNKSTNSPRYNQTASRLYLQGLVTF